MEGIRLADAQLGDFPLPYDDMPPGAYWKVLSRKTGEHMNVRDNEEDRRYWSLGSNDWGTNLTGEVWGIITPFGQYGMLSVHTVREHEDGTISVRPGDGSSNSILVSGGNCEKAYHGYIEHGVWTEC